MSGTTVFKLIQFNPRRFQRGVEAARVEVNGEWFWMSRNDIELNIKAFGEHPELLKARQAKSVRRDRDDGQRCELQSCWLNDKRFPGASPGSLNRVFGV